MKVYAVSDLHLNFSVDKPMEKFGAAWANQTEILMESCKQLSEEDLLLIAGDISWAMREDEVLADLDYIGQLNGRKVLIRGNHDYWWSTASKVRRLLPQGVYAVHNDAIRFDNVVIGGNRGVVSLDRGAGYPKDLGELQYKKLYERELARFDMSIDAMKKIAKDGDRLILMTHYPPFNNSKDRTPFMQKFEEAGIKDVVFGHIHLKSMKSSVGNGVYHSENGVRYWLTSCDILKHKPIEID